jgi:osmotically-inducible protein OsmY
MNSRLLAVLVIAALSMPALSFAQAKQSTTDKVKENVKDTTEKVKENVKDSVITTKIKAEYAKDKRVSFRRIHVDTDDNGVVTLSGTARSKAEKDKAASIAKNTEGVSSVKNKIKVQAKKASSA